MIRSYTPSLHDPILTEMNQKWKRTDQEIADAMGFDRQTVTEQRARLKLPVNARHRDKCGPNTQKPVPPPRSKPNPLEIAKFWLGNRLVERNGAYYIDGTPKKLDLLMQEANRAAKAAGAEQCGNNPAWLQ